MADKAIPNGDGAFAAMANAFASVIERDPRRFNLSVEDARAIRQKVSDFERKHLAAMAKGSRSMNVTSAKNHARKEAKEIIRRYRNRIAADDRISAADKLSLKISPRPASPTAWSCPQTPPRLVFLAALGQGPHGGPLHKLRVYHVDADCTMRARPKGATRVELFVELVEEHEEIPRTPHELSGGRPFYLRSFTSSPMIVECPLPDRPMRVVYWARWADAKGKQGPFSATCVATVEGWPQTGRALPDYAAGRRRAQQVVITSAMRELPTPREQMPALEEMAQEAIV